MIIRLWQRALRRLGRPGIAALCLAIIVVCLAAWTPRIEHDAAEVRSRLTRRVVGAGRATPDLRPERSPSESLAEYVDRFPQLTQNAIDLGEIFASAERHRVQLLKGEYQLKVERDAPFVAYSATFPVRTDYTSVKEFTADVLLKLPHASLEELRLSRETAGVEVLDSVVRFNLTYRSR